MESAGDTAKIEERQVEEVMKATTRFADKFNARKREWSARRVKQLKRKEMRESKTV